MKDIFTIEEVNLLCIFNTGSCNALIADITKVLPVFDDRELIEIAENVLNKLAAMNDDDYAAMQFFPEYGDYIDKEA